MALPGAMPLPAMVHNLKGTKIAARIKSPISRAEQDRRALEESSRPLERPPNNRFTCREAADRWEEMIAPCQWLDQSKLAAALAFCELFYEFESDPKGFSAQKHGQFRGYMADLGLTDIRNRIGGHMKKEKDEFFDK